MTNGFVYKWMNKTNGKWYIGSHKGTPDDGYIGSGLMFRSAVEKYGIENFERILLYEGEDFKAREDEILKELDAANCNDSYNLKNEALGGSFPGESNGMFGKHLSDETKKQIGETLSTGERWGDPKKRVEHSDKMSGKNNPMFGVKRIGTWSIQKMKATVALRQKKWSFLKSAKHHRTVFTKIFRDVVRRGKFVSPRGKLIVEVENFTYRLPPYVRFCNFECRKLNLNYVKNEFLWYLKGDRFDQSITEHASMWKGLVNCDGSINSNYGQYVFGEQQQFTEARKVLENDRDSRRASIVILADRHMKMETNDVPCTYSINFRIRENKLNMSVHMRSQDAIYGMGNDAPAFSFIHEMMLNTLQRKYPGLEYGEYFHVADSFHVYEKHFEMLTKLSGYEKKEGSFTHKEKARLSSYKTVLCPRISGPDEVDFMLAYDFSIIPDSFEFTKWLTTKDEEQ